MQTLMELYLGNN
jgi:Leucine-rich repeat (LRR) protein